MKKRDRVRQLTKRYRLARARAWEIRHELFLLREQKRKLLRENPDSTELQEIRSKMRELEREEHTLRGMPK